MQKPSQPGSRNATLKASSSTRRPTIGQRVATVIATERTPGPDIVGPVRGPKAVRVAGGWNESPEACPTPVHQAPREPPTAHEISVCVVDRCRTPRRQHSQLPGADPALRSSNIRTPAWTSGAADPDEVAREPHHLAATH